MINSKNGVIGLAVGDAMGVPLEFCIREKLQKNITTEMLGYGSHNVPKGTWSDDTSMTLGLIDAINKTGIIIPSDIADNFVKWAENAEFTATDVRFDIGRTCLRAIANYEGGINPTECGLDDEFSNGNGSLMRILPLIYYCYAKNMNNADIYKVVRDVSSITHRHEISIMGCYIYVLFGIELLKGTNLNEAYKKIRESDYSMFSKQCKEKYNRIINTDISLLNIDEISSSGYVVDTLEATLWGLLTTDNYNSAIIKVINLGNDTDTIGACVGGLAGIYYGLEAVNPNWLNGLLKYDYIAELCERFNGVLNKANSKKIPEDNRDVFFIDIREREKREKFVNEILEFEGMSLINNNADSFELAKEAVIKSIFPISIDFKKLELDFLKNTTTAAAAITNKSIFITPEEALKKVESRLNEWKKFKEEVIISLTTQVYEHTVEYAKELVESYELDIFEDFFLKNETPLDCAIDIGYSCG